MSWVCALYPFLSHNLIDPAPVKGFEKPIKPQEEILSGLLISTEIQMELQLSFMYIRGHIM